MQSCLLILIQLEKRHMLAFKGRGIYEKLIEISLIEILCDAVTSVTIQMSNMFCDARHGVTKNFGGHNIFL